MYRIRFHGRGGQGMKTASRIVGTTAFRQGYHAQDSPVYGAERRGAPMVAFTRFDSHPILERGLVASPDLVVIADASLLDDPLVRPLQGLSHNGSILINSTRQYESFPSVSCDFTGIALEHAGTTSALSVALAAAAAQSAGLDLKYVEAAVHAELEDLKFSSAQIDKNIKLAHVSFDEMSKLTPTFCDRPGPSQTSENKATYLVTPTYIGPWAGTASVATSPNTSVRKTGDWRVMRPVIDLGRCTHCWICFLNCPDGAISLSGADVPKIDYGVCKGCLICAEECPIEAITTSREVGEPIPRSAGLMEGQ